MKKHFMGYLLAVCCVVLLIMIYMGMNGKALAPRQKTFIYQKDSALSNDASTYVKGVIHKDHIKLDLSHVNTHVPGIYPAYVKQSNRTYEFQIEIK